ncbi:hypothetical protein [Natrinema ejinorense]|uniref:Uncharacterized protein n=1 Tax=Natrinema ejinorense TaxID=373386 RepID=A0A2A5QPA2_9EURY|nr:hypothetical protein [Natrinema ejinorense]PCR88681.1 hypothetical protein CP557_21880 [Natrinema ejinorense]
MIQFETSDLVDIAHHDAESSEIDSDACVAYVGNRPQPMVAIHLYLGGEWLLEYTITDSDSAFVAIEFSDDTLVVADESGTVWVYEIDTWDLIDTHDFDGLITDNSSLRAIGRLYEQ